MSLKDLISIYNVGIPLLVNSYKCDVRSSKLLLQFTLLIADGLYIHNMYNFDDKNLIGHYKFARCLIIMLCVTIFLIMRTVTNLIPSILSD